MPRRPDLDALRGVAVLLVVLAHAAVPGLPSTGTIGVTAFFVLSGWLITSLLLAEDGGPDLPAFWRRRARRLLPALVALLLVLGAVDALTGVVAFAPPAAALGALLFVDNWAPMLGVPLQGLNHAWSLAVEEQFYLLWPLAVAVAARGRDPRRRLAIVAALGVLGSVGVTLLLAARGASTERLYYGTDVRVAALLVGALLACRPPAGAGRRGVGSRGWLLASVLLLALAALPPQSRVTLVLTPWLTAVVTAGLVACAATPTWRWLRHLGERSYALYLWHHPLLIVAVPWLLQERGGSRPWLVLGAIALSVVLAEASWRWVEQPFLRAPGNARTPGRRAGGPFVRRSVPADA